MDNVIDLEILKAGKHNVNVIDWPGTKNKIGITILTEAELKDSQFAVEHLFKKNEIEFSAATADAYQRELNTQMLSRALVHPVNRHKNGDPVKIFFSADELRDAISHPDVKSALVDEYHDWQNACSPFQKKMTEPEYAALFESVKKNGASALSGSDSNTLSELIIFLADRARKLPMDSGPILQ